MKGEDIHEGELAVKDGKIQYIDSKPKNDGFEGKEIDLSDCMVMPGFVNAHCHLSLSALHRKIPQTDSFTEWVPNFLEQNKMVSDEERLRGLLEGAKTLYQSGVTTLADFLMNYELIPEYAKLPFRQIIFLEALGFLEECAEEICEGVEAVYRENKDISPLVNLGIAPHATYSVSPKLIRALRDLSFDFECPFSCHVAELKEEVEFLQTGDGPLKTVLENLNVWEQDWEPPEMSPLQYLEHLDVLDTMVGIHMNYIGNDKNILVSNFMSGVFCPGSTRWFGRKEYMPVKALMSGSIPVGIGTDSLASNDSLNYLNELRIAKEMLPDLTSRELLELATFRGAETLGLKTGVLSAGMPADIIAFRIEGKPESYADIPFESGREQADFVMTAGRIAHKAST